MNRGVHEHRIESGGQSIAALSANDDLPGVPIVFLHGITASVEFWEPSLPEEIREGRRWISLSLPGHYPSRMPSGMRPDEVTEVMFAEIHRAALDHLLGGTPAALVGWSTGGFSALNLATRFPQLVQSVMCISGFSVGCWGGLVGFLQRVVKKGTLGRRIFRDTWRQLGRSPRLFAWSIGQAAGDRRAFRQSPVMAPTLEGWRLAVAQHDLDGLALLFDRLAELDIRPQLQAIRVPVLIVGGDRDPYIPVAHTRALAASIPGAELSILPGVGHMFFAEATDRYHALLRDWLSRTAMPVAGRMAGAGVT